MSLYNTYTGTDAQKEIINNWFLTNPLTDDKSLGYLTEWAHHRVKTWGPKAKTFGFVFKQNKELPELIKTFIFEKALAGGQICASEWIENFPGFPEGISGIGLAEKMKVQAKNCGAELVEENAASITRQGNSFIVKTDGSEQYSALSVIVATGARPKRLGIKGEEEFIGKGISYCATCDGPLFKEKTVAIS